MSIFSLYIFGFVGFFLAPLSVTYFLLPLFFFSFFSFSLSLFFSFGGRDCIPVLLIIWPKVSSTGVCRELCRASVLKCGPLGDHTGVNILQSLRGSSNLLGR